MLTPQVPNFMLPTAESTSGSSASFGDALGNLVTGNLDYKRELEKLGLEQDFTREMTNANNIFNAEQAALQRAENRYLRSTQYQTAVEDMKKSGLNPYLALGGNGNAVGSAASASASTVASPNSTISASGHLGKTLGTAISLLGTAISAYSGFASASIPKTIIKKR